MQEDTASCWERAASQYSKKEVAIALYTNGPNCTV